MFMSFIKKIPKEENPHPVDYMGEYITLGLVTYFTVILFNIFVSNSITIGEDFSEDFALLFFGSFAVVAVSLMVGIFDSLMDNYYNKVLKNQSYNLLMSPIVLTFLTLRVAALSVYKFFILFIDLFQVTKKPEEQTPEKSIY